VSDSEEADEFDFLINQAKAGNNNEGDEVDNNFLGSLEDFMLQNDRTGPSISEELAKVLNKSFQIRPSEEKAKKLCEKYFRPENCDNLTVPRCNPEVWPTLRKKSQSVDYKLQKTQSVILKAMVPTCNLLDKLLATKKKKKSMQAASPKETNEMLDLAQDTIKLLQLAFSDLSHKRRYLIRPELKSIYKPLCNDSNEVTSFLFGDHVDEEIKKIDASRKVGKKLNDYHHSSSARFNNNNFGSNNNPFLGKGRGRKQT
jgi:hypothetical protein